MRFLALVRDTPHGHTRADSPASLSSPPRHLCRSPGPGPSVASPSCPKPHLSRAVKLTPAQTTHIRALTRTLQIIDATEPAARTRGYAPPRVPSPRVRERARVCAPRLRPVALAAAIALPRRQQPRRRRPPPPRRGYAAPRVPSPSSERHGAGRRRARASVALLLLQARRAAPATTPRRLSLGGVEVGRARSRGRGGRHRSGRGHGGPRGRRASRRACRRCHPSGEVSRWRRWRGLWRCERG